MPERIDVSATLAAKSDQLNAADLGQPVTVQVERVTLASGPEQPVEVHLVGFRGRPWKPCKTMRRLLVALWGADAAMWAGRWLRLHCDTSVEWAGAAVGGVRVLAASHIDTPLLRPLPVKRGKSSVFRVDVIRPSDVPSADPLLSTLASLGLTLAALDAATPEGTPLPSASTGPRRAKLAEWLTTPAAADRIAAARALTSPTQDSP